jgi:hypothetical protein
MFQETYCGFPITQVYAKGIMTVYEREGYRSLGVPKFVVFHSNGKALEEIRTKRSAIKWANDNHKG